MGGRGQRMIDEHARIKRLRQGPQRYHHAHERTEHDSVLDRSLTALIRYKLLMPSAMAFHSSWSFGRNSVMAMMAITTRTPTKMAYSVVP